VDIANGAVRWESPLEPLPKKPSKPKPRIQGPGDEVTNPKAIKLLQGHKTEVVHSFMIQVAKYTEQTFKLSGLCMCMESSDTTIVSDGVFIRQPNNSFVYSTDIMSLLRSKDAVVNLWTVPEQKPPSWLGADAATPTSLPPMMLDHFAKTEQGDLTSLHWNSDGTLLAIGSYDSVLRICTASGGLYFSHPQHQVRIIMN